MAQEGINRQVVPRNYISRPKAAKILGIKPYVLTYWVTTLKSVKEYIHPVTKRQLFDEEEIIKLAERINCPAQIIEPK